MKKDFNKKYGITIAPVRPTALAMPQPTVLYLVG